MMRLMALLVSDIEWPATYTSPVVGSVTPCKIGKANRCDLVMRYNCDAMFLRYQIVLPKTAFCSEVRLLILLWNAGKFSHI